MILFYWPAPTLLTHNGRSAFPNMTETHLSLCGELWQSGNKPISWTACYTWKTHKNFQQAACGSRLSWRWLRNTSLKIYIYIYIYIYCLILKFRAGVSCEGHVVLWALQDTEACVEMQCFQAQRGNWVWVSTWWGDHDPGLGSEAKGPTTICHVTISEEWLFVREGQKSKNLLLGAWCLQM